MNARLFLQAAVKFLAGLLIVGALLFLSAGSFAFFGGWLFLGVLFLPMLTVGIVLAVKDPALLEKRLSAKEGEKDQKIVVLLSALMFVSAFILAGLNYRFEWIVQPVWTNCAAAVIFLGAYLLYAEVLRENSYLSRTVEVQENQKVIDTGLYGVVRHPMYLSTLLLFFSMPLVLGSLWSLCVMLLYIPIIVLRIKNEEKVLEENLEGYAEYKKKVKYRIVPYIW